MLRFMVVGLLMCASLLNAEEPETFKLAAPNDWSGESMELPPGFARDMKLKGFEHIRFAPGMMKPASASFFSYAFVFEIESRPVITESVLKDEFLKYYRGLCVAVLNGKLPDVDPDKFTVELKKDETNSKPADDGSDADAAVTYSGTMDWVEPFATRKPQKLNLEMRTWTKKDRSYIFACVSPQSKEKPIWKQLHTIRDDYLKKQHSKE